MLGEVPINGVGNPPVNNVMPAFGQRILMPLGIYIPKKESIFHVII